VPPVDIRRLFNVELPAALAKNAAKASKELAATFQLNVTGPTGGQWHVSALFAPTCKPGQAPADVTVTMSDLDFQALMASHQRGYTAMSMAARGRMKVDGPLTIAMRLEKLLAYLGR
jgi:hypothetical protein